MRCTQARNREAGCIGQTALRYDRTSGRYYDIDLSGDPNRDICPIKPLHLERPGDAALGTSGDAAQVAHQLLDVATPAPPPNAAAAPMLEPDHDEASAGWAPRDGNPVAAAYDRGGMT